MDIFRHPRRGTRQGPEAVQAVIDILAQAPRVGGVAEAPPLGALLWGQRRRRTQAVEGRLRHIVAALDMGSSAAFSTRVFWARCSTGWNRL